MVQAFNIPTPTNYLGNAMQINRAEDQRQTQNALMQRDQQMQEQQFQGQQQDRQTAQAAAQRKLQADVRLAALRTLQGVPEAQRRQVFESMFHGDPDWVQAAGEGFSQSVLSNPLALTDGYIGMGINKLGELTQQQQLEQKRNETRAGTVPKEVLTVGPNGQPVRMFVDPFDGKTYDDTQTAAQRQTAAQQAAELRQRAIDAAENRKVQREGQRISADNSRRTAGAAGMTAAQTAKVQDKLQATRMVRAQLARAKAAFAKIQGTFSAGPGGNYLPTQAGQRFDAVANGLQQTIRQLTRTPGEGAMSDYESRLAQAIVPTRGGFEGLTAAKLDELEQLVNDIESGYTGLSSPSTAPPDADIDALLKQYGQ